MNEATTTNKHRRIPFVAVALSLVSTGLGHWYCGRIVKGLLFGFLSIVFLPLFLWAVFLSASPVRVFLAAFAFIASSVVSLVAIIDSYYIAKHTRLDYQLKDYNRWYVYLLLILSGLILSFGSSFEVRENYMKAFRCTGQNMVPTIIKGDRFLANKMVYRKEETKRGDVVVFSGLKDPRVNWIRRVVALAGDRIEMSDGILFINGKELERLPVPTQEKGDLKHVIKGDLSYEINNGVKYKIIPITQQEETDTIRDFDKITVPLGHCFVMGDNRDASKDSRHFGPIPLVNIKGRIDYIYSPLRRFQRVK